MAERLSAPKGTYDVLPDAGSPFPSRAWRAAVDALAAPARRAGYAYAETPIFEDTALFVRGVGESTDVVTKEMYTFDDRGGRSLTLRPEGTAGVVRAMLEHGLDRGPLPLKLWYAGPMFRYERPQAGRYRQFAQVGLEALGVDDPALDAEVVLLAVRGLAEVGLTGVTLLLNSMGDAACRPVYVETLRAYLDTVADQLCAECNRRREVNPLRVLDEKRPQCQAAIAGAPVLVDCLCAPCKEHYDEVRAHLGAAGVEWVEAPRLVRGLDYYRRTTFELQHGGLGAQNAVGGGGRYDGLAESIGGSSVPGIGWAFGLDRVLLALGQEAVAALAPGGCDVYLVPAGVEAKRRCTALADRLRGNDISVETAFGDRSVKAAMKAADRAGARLVVLVGERELADGVVTLKDMATGEQHAVPADAAVDAVATALQTARDTRSPLTPQEPSP